MKKEEDLKLRRKQPALFAIKLAHLENKFDSRISILVPEVLAILTVSHKC